VAPASYNWWPTVIFLIVGRQLQMAAATYNRRPTEKKLKSDQKYRISHGSFLFSFFSYTNLYSYHPL